LRIADKNWQLKNRKRLCLRIVCHTTPVIAQLENTITWHDAATETLFGGAIMRS